MGCSHALKVTFGRSLLTNSNLFVLSHYSTIPQSLRRDYPDQLSSIVSLKLQAIEQSRLKFTIGDHEIVVKEKVERIVARVMNFQALVGSVVSCNPHASIAWAGVSVLLTVSSYHVTYYRCAPFSSRRDSIIKLEREFGNKFNYTWSLYFHGIDMY